MKNTTAYLLGAIAGALSAMLVYKNRNRINTEKIGDTMDDWMKSARRLGIKVRNTLLNDVSGPDGESVFEDMYYRRYYENKLGSRVYLDE